MAKTDENATSRQIFEWRRVPFRGTTCRAATGCRGAAAEEHPIGGFGRFVDVVVAETVEETPELRAVLRRHLHADEHAPVVRAVVSVMEQADVPAGAHAVQETHQRARPLGELEPVQDLSLIHISEPT